MDVQTKGADIYKSALIIVDMQNDFVHPDGNLGHRARSNPASGIDIEFLNGSVDKVKRLAAVFREAARPVIYIAHVLKPDYSDAQFPYWRLSPEARANRTFITEGTWGAQIVDELAPRPNEHVIIKKGYGAFSNTPLDTILRNLGVTTCVVAGVTTCVCVSTTIRGGVEHNYRMILAYDAAAERNRESHDAEVQVLGRAFADVMSTDEIAKMLSEVR